MNFLEQLVAEWYELRGYFVSSNIRFGKRSKGGHEGEIDVAACDPKGNGFVPIETSMDADSWKERKAKFRRTFSDASRHYNCLFDFERDSESKIAVAGFGKPRSEPDCGPGIQVKSIPEFMREIAAGLREIDPKNRTLPEGLPLLRAIQFALFYGVER